MTNRPPIFRQFFVATGFIVAAASCLPWIIADARAATLEDELKRLLEEHPRIAAEHNALLAAKDGIGLARSQFLPVLSVNGDIGHETTDSRGPRTAEFGDLKARRLLGGMELRQNLFSGFGSLASKRVAEITTGVAQETLRATTQSVLLEAIASYLDVLRHSELIGLARGNVQTIEIQLRLEDERVQRGSGIAVDVLLAKSRLQIAKERRAAIEGSLGDATSRYMQVFGHAPDIATMRAPRVPTALLPTSVEAGVAALEKLNPAVQASQLQIDAADAVRRGAGSGDFPRVDLVAAGNFEDNVDGTEGIRRDYSVKLELNWELFSGLATKFGKSQTAYRAAAARNNAHFIRRKAREELEFSWNAWTTQSERRDLLANAVNITGEVFDSRIELRDAGKETAINVLDAENELYGACINFLNADYDAAIAVYRVLLAVGRLEPRTLGLLDDAERIPDVKKMDAVSTIGQGAKVCGLY